MIYADFTVDDIKYTASGIYEDENWTEVRVDDCPNDTDEEDFIDENWNLICGELGKVRRA